MATEEKQPLTSENVPNEAQNQSSTAQTTAKEVELDANVTAITCGIAWDFFGTKIDLDVTVVALDTYSFEMDAAYYNQPSILGGSIIHSGDNKSGLGEGDDEEIQIDLSKLPPRCRSLWFIVNAFSGGNFKDVETARFTLYDGNDHSQTLYSYGIGMAFNSTALLIGVLSVDDPYSEHKQWSFKMIEARGNGRNFVESKAILVDNLGLLYDEGILMERPRDRNQKYELEKGDLYVIDPAIVSLSVGLGWDPDAGGIDVDASVIVFNKIGDLSSSNTFSMTEIVYFGMKDYVGAVRHGGDNLTGDGAGDDEVIAINLDKLNANEAADVLCLVINIYSGESSFRNIRNCFARLVDEKNKELCRFNLTETCNTQAMIMCHVEKRSNGCWAMCPDGIGCSGTMAKHSVEDAIKILKGEHVAQTSNLDTEHETQGLLSAGHNQASAERTVQAQSGGCGCVLL
eukprot:742_1